MREAIMSRVTNALSMFDSGSNCAQAVLTSFIDTVGIDGDMALKIACGFGAGMGKMGKTCGAVTGAFMVIGLKCGHTKGDDTESKENTYALVREFSDLFSKDHGSVECCRLLSCDINTPGGLKQAYEQKLFHTLCPKYVESAVTILEKIL